MKKGFLVFISVLFISSLAPSVFAQTTPQVSNFTANPSTVNTGTLLGLSWTLANSSGYSIKFTCPSGVTAFNNVGTSVACDTRIAVSSAGSGSTEYSFVNLTGVSQRIFVTMYPKDSAGADSDGGSMTTNFYVNPVVNPINDFTSSTLTPQSGSPFTLTWTSHHITGVNIKIDCTADVSVTTPLSALPVACGSFISSSNLAAAGSQSITATNKSLFSSPITATIFPAIASGSVDGTNAKGLSLSVGGALPPKDASASSFLSASSTVLANATSTFTWVTADAAGANIQIACMDAVTIFDSAGTVLPCGRPAFGAPIKTASTTAVRIVNQSESRKPLKVSLYLLRADGTYTGVPDRDITVTVLGVGEALFPSTSLLTPALLPPSMQTLSTTSVVPTTGVAGKSTTALSATLRKGMRHAQVTALQTFLSLDSTIYPEASVTGLFGPATERAVQHFQKRYKLADEKNSAYGIVGPGTRAKINSLLKP